MFLKHAYKFLTFLHEIPSLLICAGLSNWILVHGIGQNCCENAMYVWGRKCDTASMWLCLSRSSAWEPSHQLCRMKKPRPHSQASYTCLRWDGPADVPGKRPLQLLHVCVTAFRWFSFAASWPPSWCQVEKKWAGLTDLHPTALLWNKTDAVLSH